MSFHWFISEKIFFTYKSVNFHQLNQWKKYFLLLNQLISTEVISEIWLIYSNLLLANWINQISLIISRFWLWKSTLRTKNNTDKTNFRFTANKIVYFISSAERHILTNEESRRGPRLLVSPRPYSWLSRAL